VGSSVVAVVASSVHSAPTWVPANTNAVSDPASALKATILPIRLLGFGRLDESRVRSTYVMLCPQELARRRVEAMNVTLKVVDSMEHRACGHKRTGAEPRASAFPVGEALSLVFT